MVEPMKPGAACAAARDMARAIGVALALDDVERATVLPHGDGRRESVALHSYSLVLVLAAIDEHLPQQLIRRRLYAYAAVHDAIEMLTGDTDTSVWTPELQAAKEAREKAAAKELLAILPASLRRIWERYERQNCPEARVVRLIDKMMPKLFRAIAHQQDPGLELPDVATIDRELAAQAARLQADAPQEWAALEPLFWATAEWLRAESAGVSRG